MCAVVPLLIDGQPQGVLNLKRLLPQKKDFTEIDREIFTLLSNQVALLLANAAFYRLHQGKIDFEQGFFAQDLS
jgi:GAF domain-containing protein